jgi:hypothetical protein
MAGMKFMKYLNHIGLALILVLGAWGCGGSSTPTKRAMALEGVMQLPPSKGGQVATYRCSIDLSTGKAEVSDRRRTGTDEEAVWNKMSPRLRNDDRTLEIVFEENEKATKGAAADWALVSVVESDAAGKILRKIPVQEFWGAFDSHTQRALMMKDGRFQFFVQFWTAEGKP